MKLTDIQSAEIDDMASVLDEVLYKLEKAKIVDEQIQVPTRVIAEMLYLRGMRVVED